MTIGTKKTTTIALGLGVVLSVFTGCGGNSSSFTEELVEGAPEGILVFVIGNTAADSPAADTLRAWSDADSDAVDFGRHYVSGTSTEESLRALLTGFPFAASDEASVRPTLPELSSRMGYTTFALTAGEGLGSAVSSGFDVVRDDLSAADPIPQLVREIHGANGPFLGFVYVPIAGAVSDWLQRLDELPEFERMVVAVTSDHGPIQDGGAIDREFRESVIRVPMVVKFPSGEKPETLPARTTSITSSIDLLPSLLALVGRDISGALPGSNALDGYFSGGAFVTGEDAWAFVQDNHKVVVSGEKAWVFDLAADPQEQNDLATTSPELAKGLLQLAVQTREMLSRDAVAEVDEEMDEETLEHLRSLGYIQ